MSGAVPDERWSLGYRPALDGVRGIAILLVLGAHAFGNWGRAATTGVTLFFVLSGFLITTLLIEERHRTGRINLLAFYGRRARRLLPALCMVCAVVGAAMLVAGAAAEVPGTLLPPLLYFQNWVIADERAVLAHTWSLAIEEQFYIAWPAALIAALAVDRGRDRAAVVVLALGVATSLLVRHTGSWDPSGDEFGTVARGDALLIGCLIAFGIQRGVRLPSWSIAIGIGLIAAVILVPVLSPTILTIITLGCAVVVATTAVNPHRILSWRPLTLVGLISYGLYLIHQPVLKTLRPLLLEAGWPSLGGIVGLMALSIGLAITSWLLVERRFVRRRSAPSPALAGIHRRDRSERLTLGGARTRQRPTVDGGSDL